MGRDVAVHDRERVALLILAIVGEAQRLEHLAHDEQREPDGERLVLLHPLDQARQIRALHVLHRHVERAFRGAEVEHLHDVLVLEQHGDPRLVDEELHELLVAREIVEDLLDDERLLEASEAVGAGLPDLSHATDRDPFDEVILPELLGCALVRQPPSRHRRILPRSRHRAAMENRWKLSTA